jgi:hypothetical protein
VDAPPTLLALLVAQSERSQAEVCAAFRQCARDHGENADISVRTLRRWMYGGDGPIRPRPAQSRVARLYWGHPMSQLLGPPPTERPDDDPLAALNRQSALAAPGLATSRTADTPAEITKDVLMAAKRAARFASYAEDNNIGREAVDQLRDDINRLAGDYLRQPLPLIMNDLLDAQTAIFEALEGRQKPALTTDLYVLASIASGMLSKASHDLGRVHEAMTQARTMFVCADNIGHAALQAWARGQQALIAFRAGRLHDATRYAAQGSRIADQLHGSVAAWLPALQARALAQLPDPAMAREQLALADLHREHHQPDDLDDIGGLFAFSPAKQHYYAAGALVHLGDADHDAEHQAQAAIAIFSHGTPEEQSFSTEAGARAELALARVHADALDGAREALQPVLALGPERRIEGILHSVSQVHHALTAPRYVRSPVAAELRDQIEAFRRTPVAALAA